MDDYEHAAYIAGVQYARDCRPNNHAITRAANRYDEWQVFTEGCHAELRRLNKLEESVVSIPYDTSLDDAEYAVDRQLRDAGF